MIVCHCQNISERDIHNAIDWMRDADECAIITPRKIYRALGKSPDCGSCMPLFLSSMRSNAKLEVPLELRGLKPRVTDPSEERKESGDERRFKSY